MLRNIFTIARSDKKSQKKALEKLHQEGFIDASEVLGGRQDDGGGGNPFFIKQEASMNVNDKFQDLNDIL
jgi:hypothetical protein